MLAYEQIAKHGVFIASFTNDAGESMQGLCAVDWERLRAGECEPYASAKDEQHLLDVIAKAWEEIGCHRVTILGSESIPREEVERILSMEGNLGAAFQQRLDQVEH